MVQTSSIIAMIINIIICFGLPLGFILYLVIRKRRTIVPILVGAAVFLVFQLIIRIPLITYVLPPMDWYAQMTARPWLYGIFLGLTAGLFEELGRFGGFSLLKKNRRYIDGIAFGVGHGGIEAIVIVGMSNISNLVLALSINNGGFDQIAALLPEETAQLIVTQLTQTPVIDFYLGGIERIFAFTIQIALSLLVLYAVKERKFIYVVVAILLHMVIDAPLVILPRVFGVTAYQLEIILGAIAVCAFVFILMAKKLFKPSDDRPEKESIGTAQQ
ncbi:MAG: YhfC family glutamic-type intramembrane protease [Eubacteriales bacterium]|nr:YhfC family glutamic-type intramembrane protease [Eubacteriales bacterium]